MADAFTPNFNLTLPEIGGSFDTWGGKLNANLNIIDRHLVFPGLICFYEGLAADIPEGWALCDGTNGTPNLVDKFVVGAGGEYEVGDTGGANNVTLTSAQMPSHGHSGSTGTAGGHNHTGSTNTTGSHSHSGTANTAGNHRHSMTTYADSGEDYSGRISHYATVRYTGTAYTNYDGNHTHSLSINSNGNHSHTFTTSTGGGHTHLVTVENTGGGESHENRPPYYALAFVKFIGTGA